MTKHIVVFITAPNEEEGAKLARTLVEERLCACVNIMPKIRSIYRWKGEICDEPEVMMIAKSAATMAAAIVKRVRELHSYDVPEIICLPVATGSGEYLDWIDDSLKTDSEDEGGLEI